MSNTTTAAGSSSNKDSLATAAPPQGTTVSSPPVVDLKHMTSQSALGLSPTTRGGSGASAGNRISQHLRTGDHRIGGGSKSPSSIPSSPTSIHSSSSAIFERDIEPILPPSSPSTLHHHHHPINPHRIPRAKGTEALEQAVPSVLDSAAAILGGLEDVEVVAPAATPASSSSISFDTIGRTSGFASPIGSFRSRSPSPHSTRTQQQRGAGEVLLTIPVPITSGSSPQAQATPASVLGLQLNGQMTSVSISSSPPRPQLQTNDTTTTITAVPSISTPIADLSPATSASASPRLQDVNNATLPSPGLSPIPLSPTLLSTTSPSATSPPISYPPSPVHLPKKRLSFMSYSDLLSSTPATAQPLSSLTTCASTSAEPPHIPSVSGLNIVNAIHAQQQVSASHSPSLQTSALFAAGSTSTSATPSLHGFSLLTHAGKRDSIAVLDNNNLGGEWERQGLGRGLEERLEALVIPIPGASNSTAAVPSPGVPHQPQSPAVLGAKA